MWVAASFWILCALHTQILGAHDTPQTTEYFVLPVPFRGNLDGFVQFKIAYDQPLTPDEQIILADLVYSYVTKVLCNMHRVTYISSRTLYRNRQVDLERLSDNLTDVARTRGINCSLRIVSCEYIAAMTSEPA